MSRLLFSSCMVLLCLGAGSASEVVECLAGPDGTCKGSEPLDNEVLLQAKARVDDEASQITGDEQADEAADETDEPLEADDQDAQVAEADHGEDLFEDVPLEEEEAELSEEESAISTQGRWPTCSSRRSNQNSCESLNAGRGGQQQCQWNPNYRTCRESLYIAVPKINRCGGPAGSHDYYGIHEQKCQQNGLVRRRHKGKPQYVKDNWGWVPVGCSYEPGSSDKLHYNTNQGAKNLQNGGNDFVSICTRDGTGWAHTPACKRYNKNLASDTNSIVKHWIGVIQPQGSATHEQACRNKCRHVKSSTQYVFRNKDNMCWCLSGATGTKDYAAGGLSSGQVCYGLNSDPKWYVS